MTTWFSGWVEGLIAGALFGSALTAVIVFAFLKNHPQFLG